MANFILLVEIFLIVSIFSSAKSLHLGQIGNAPLPDPLDASNRNGNTSSNISDADAPVSVKGNIGSLTSIISNPTQIINQIQSTVNTFLQTLNNTLSGSSSNVTSLLGSLKNITNKPSGSFRLEDADQIFANISEIVRNSSRSESELVSNTTTQFEKQIHGAFEDFRKTILELRSSAQGNLPGEHAMMERKSDNATTLEPEVESTTEDSNKGTSRKNRKAKGLPRTLFDQLSSIRTQVDSRIQRSVSIARSTIEDSLDIARQNSQIMRNQTSVFMNEMQRILNEFSAPFRSFFEILRRGRPTAVVTA